MEHSKLLLTFLNDCCDRIDRKQRPLHFRREWWKTGAASVALGLSLALGACSSDGSDPQTEVNADDTSADAEDVDAKADGASHPQGTYQNQGTTGDIKLLFVNADKTLQAELLSGGSMSGTYKFTKGGSTRYLRVLLDDGTTVIRYAYTLSSSTLKLRKVGTSVTYTLKGVKESCNDGKDNDFDGAIDCGDSDCSSSSQCGVKYGVPYELDCGDNADNDGDGKIDCADPDCVTSGTCGGTKYGIPYEGDCTDGVDNDKDGAKDCDDDDCKAASNCIGTKYGIPMEYESACDDNIDNDKDGKVDCADPDCAGPSCGGLKYGVPYETDCTDGVDNDNDGLMDCSDGDCITETTCVGTKYGIPYEADCSDGIDNDNDGKIDCGDAECQTSPNCMGAKYAAPQN